MAAKGKAANGRLTAITSTYARTAGALTQNSSTQTRNQNPTWPPVTTGSRVWTYSDPFEHQSWNFKLILDLPQNDSRHTLNSRNVDCLTIDRYVRTLAFARTRITSSNTRHE